MDNKNFKEKISEINKAILSDDSKYNIPDDFTSRSAEILQVYLKSLGVRMTTVYEEDEE